MPLTPPVIDDRRVPQLVDDMLARARVHTPEWTNFNESDPGVTLVQLFAFLTENLLYRANLIPERNRVKFLNLLGAPLAPASAAEGLATIDNERGPLSTQTLPSGLELRAGAIPFRTEQGLAVLPVEARVFFKRRLAAPSPALLDYYRLLYASYQAEMPVAPLLYETVAFDPTVVDRVDLGADTVDRSLWIALLGRPGDLDRSAKDPWKILRDEIGGQTLSLGVAPALDATQLRLSPGASTRPSDLLAFELPRVTADRAIARDKDGRPLPSYRPLPQRADVDVLATPGVTQITLPAASELGSWTDLDPLEAGVGDMPPSLEDTPLAERLVTWLRLRAAGAAQANLRWVGINCVRIRQRERIIAEPLANGDGTPDQQRRLARAPVLKGSVEIVTQQGAEQKRWSEIDDLMAAGPEISTRDGGADASADSNVFSLDCEAGVLTFGDGLRGRRLPLDARVFATYEFCRGAAGNVAPRAIRQGPLLPSGFTATNPIGPWGGADAEDVADGEKQIKRYLQHRDRAVSVEDFESIAWRTPGVAIGRVEALPAFDPDLGANEPGSAPGVVTILAIPRFDPAQPDAPRADRMFLNAICRYLNPRRLITTELIVRGPDYKPLWISVGVEIAAGLAVAEVVEDVKRRLLARLAPVSPSAAAAGYAAQSVPLFAQPSAAVERGWPLRTAVTQRMLLAEAARATGVTGVVDLFVAEGANDPRATIEMTGLELPRVVALSVVPGEPVPIAALRGNLVAAAGGAGDGAVLLPVPVIPETC